MLEPPRNRPIVLEGIIEARPNSHFHQPVVDPFFGMIPPGPVLAQLAVSFFQVLLVEDRLPQAVDVGLDANIVEVP